MQIQDSISKLKPSYSVCRAIHQVQASNFSTRQFLDQYRRTGVPLVVSGLVNLEPAWDLDYLTQVIGEQSFPLRCYGRDRYEQDKRNWTSLGSGVSLQSQSFSKYAEMLKSGEASENDIYLGRCSLNQTPLANTLAILNAEKQLGLCLPATHLNLWLGASGHTACLHYDPMDSVLMQMHGSKHVILFPPSQLDTLYPFPIYRQIRHGLAIRPGYSQVYPDRPDLEAFPLFREAMRHRHEVVIHPGDVLFIPAGWWHEITTLGQEMVCSVNRFWHVLPLSRSLAWNKWRVHLGSMLALPHVLGMLVNAVGSDNRHLEMNKLLQKL